MKKILIIISILFLNCTNRTSQKPENVIPSSKMIQILEERQLIISQCNTYQYQDIFEKNRIDSLLKNSYKKLGYSDHDFQKSWNYYLELGNQELYEMYDSILVKLQMIQEEARN